MDIQEISLVLMLAIVGLVATERTCPVSNPGCVCGFDDHDIITTITCSGLGPMDSTPSFNSTSQIVPTVVIENSVIFKLPSKAFEGLKVRNLLLNNISVSLVEPGALDGLKQYLESLEMKNSKFVVLPDDFLADFLHLKTVALDYNMLDIIKANWFKNLPSLTYMSLTANQIRDIQPGSFDSLPNLRVLYLTKNRLTHLPSQLFKQLTSITDLGLGDNQIQALPVELFVNQGNLETLDLGRNQIEVIPDEIFQGTPALKKLFMPSNLLREIGPTKLPTGGALQELILSNNNISVLQDSVFNHVDDLRILALDNNRIPALPPLAFEYLRELRVLNLEDNHLSELPANILVGLLQLRDLNLHHNNIEILTFGVFDPLGSLVHLDMSRNLLKEIHYGPFDALRKMEYLDLSQNRLAQVKEDWFWRQGALKKLFLNNNVIRSIEAGSFLNTVNLEELQMDYNYIQELNQSIFSANSELRVLSLSHNPLKKAPVGSFGALHKLQRLYLNYTCLADLPDGFFENLVDLEDLYLDHSPISRIPSYTFSSLTGLRTLVLGYHNITKIEPRPFNGIATLTHLTADMMNLVPNDLANMLIDLPQLTYLSLKHNKLDNIQSNAFDVNRALKMLSLAGNSFECTCQMAWLREYDHLIDIDRTLCVNPDGSRQRAACFPLPDGCASVSALPTTEQVCQNPAMVTVDKAVLDYDHCIVPPEPTTPLPTTVTTTPLTTIRPAEIAVFANDTRITVTWDKSPNTNVIGYRVRYRRFATNVYIFGPDLGVNSTEFVIDVPESGLNYRVCVDLKLHGGYHRSEPACREIGINLPPVSPTRADDISVKPVEQTKGINIVPIVGAAAGAFIVIFIIIVIIVISLRKTRTRFAENARKKEEQDQMVKDKMGAWVNNFNFDGNVNETMGEQMMLDYDLFSGDNATVSKARHAQMMKESADRSALPPNGHIVNDGPDTNVQFTNEVITDDVQLPRKDSSIDEEFPGDVSGSDPGYGESETGYNGSDSMQGDSVRNENFLY